MPESAGEMRDSADEIAFWNLLPLEACHPILDAFDVVDAKALRIQRRHQWVTVLAALAGGLAVLCAIWELGFGGIYHTAGKVLAFLEALALASTAALLGCGYFRRLKDRWLINRHKAELYRLMRFEFVTHPNAWAGGRAPAADWVRRRVGEVAALHGRPALERSTERAIVPEADGDAMDVTAATVVQIAEYYLEKRLNPQKEFLANRAQRNALWDGWFVRHVTPVLLALSVLAAFTQLIINRTDILCWSPPDLAICAAEGVPTAFWKVAFATVGAASLPVIAAMIRTLRMAFEFSRNRSRFLAAHDALAQMEVRLVHQLAMAQKSAPGTTERSRMLRDLRTCEHLLRTEHQEWLRLMLEAEWFG